MKKKTVLFLMAVMCFLPSFCQRHEIFDKDIATLQVVAGDDWLSMPVVKLNNSSVNNRLNISFDDLTHTYRRFAYKIEHCEADWTVSDQLFTSDYVSGFADGNTIDDYEESINTNVLYTHYTLTIPNENCSLRMSGNYKITVYDENDDERPVFIAYFMVTEEKMDVQMSVSSNTDIDINKAHQQVSMELKYGSLSVTDHEAQIKTVVLQNGRWDNAVINATPQYKMADGLKWDHCRDLIFPAGNEYHKYEILDVDHPTMGIDHIGWDGENYHVYPFECEPRPNYVYDEDANGSFYIRNSDNDENDITSQYVYVHYVLKCPYEVNGDVYLNGQWTYGRFLPEYKMEYDLAEKCYKATVMQKQGYYSYQFVMLDKSGTPQIMPTEGSYYQTENKYQVLVYYKGRGERADRLVAYKQVQIK